MTRVRSVALIGAGYVLAALVGAAAVAVRVALTSDAAAQVSSGMLAFADLVLFVGVFGVLAIVPTVMALVLLRPYARFWSALGFVAAAIALTGVVALAPFAAGPHGIVPPALASWSATSVLRILAAPCLAVAFGICAAVAPQRTPRLLLGAACGVEAAVFVVALETWWLPP